MHGRQILKERESIKYHEFALVATTLLLKLLFHYLIRWGNSTPPSRAQTLPLFTYPIGSHVLKFRSLSLATNQQPWGMIATIYQHIKGFGFAFAREQTLCERAEFAKLLLDPTIYDLSLSTWLSSDVRLYSSWLNGWHLIKLPFRWAGSLRTQSKRSKHTHAHTFIYRYEFWH